MVQMRVNIKSNFAQSLGKRQRQLPFALSRTINDTVYDGAQFQKRQVDRYFDGGATAFTKRGFKYLKSHKRRLYGAVYIDRIQAQYMRLMLSGGPLRPKGRALVQPVSVRLNKYGNMTRTQIPRLLAQKNTFSGVPRGRPRNERYAGIWRRKKGANTLEMLVSYKDFRQVQKKYPGYQIAKSRAQKVLPKHFDKRLAAALRSSH